MSSDEIINSIIDGIFNREGREYTNRPSDKGGPTKFGITLGDWQVYTGKPATAKDIAELTEPQAREFYRWRYILQPGFDKITDAWLRTFIIDTAVLEGRETAIKILQKILGVNADGVFGPITWAALALYPDLALLKRTLLVTRMHHLIGVMLADKRIPRALLHTTNLDNIHGWWNRVASFLGGVS